MSRPQADRYGTRHSDLVGLRANYITAQLGTFRYGTRTGAEPDCMQLVAASLTESDVTAPRRRVRFEPRAVITGVLFVVIIGLAIW